MSSARNSNGASFAVTPRAHAVASVPSRRPARPRHSAVRSASDRTCFSGLAAWVALRGEGERNRGLFWAACRLAEAGLSLPEMVDALAPAGEQVGLPQREIETTIRSAYRATHVQPASVVGQGDAPRQPTKLTGQVLS